MKILLSILLILFTVSCGSNSQEERQELILRKLVKNSYTDNWKLNDKNRANILKFEAEQTIPMLWEACNSKYFQAVIYHLENLDILEAYNSKRWDEEKEKIRSSIFDNLTSDAHSLRLESLEKLMLFGRIQDLPKIIPLLKDENKRIRKQTQGILIQMGAPFRMDLIQNDSMSDEEIDTFIAYYNKWYEKNKHRKRSDVLWEQLQKPMPSHHKQTIVNGLIATTATKGLNVTYGSDILWKEINKEFNVNVRNQMIVLMGVIADAKYVEALVQTGWLSKGSLESRLRVSWTLNRMGFQNPQPRK